jgi:hypothetical protein
MTARTAAIKVGLRASAASSSARQRTGAIRIGLLVAASSPAWAGRARQARSYNWMLRADEMWIDPKTGRPSPRLFQLLREICENRLGGIDGASIPTVQTTVTQTQAEVVATSTYARNVSIYAQGIAAAVDATTEVARNNALTGADGIPGTPEPPQVPGSSTQ